MRRNKGKLRLALLAVIALGIAFGNSSGQALKSPAQPYLEAGDRLYEQGKLKESLSAYEQALAIDPKNQYASFQIIQVNVRLSSGENAAPGALPARDYSKVSRELGPYYKDPLNKIALRPPAGWLIDNSDPRFQVKFIDPHYEAFVFVKVIPTPKPVSIGYELQTRVENLVKNLAAQIPNASLKYLNFERLVDETVLRVEVHYQAGPNLIIINTRLITDLQRVVIVTWVCPERVFIYFRPLLESSVATVTLTPQ